VLTNIFLGYSVISGIMGSLLLIFTLFFEKNKKRSRILLIWAALFLASSFATSESAFWYEGYNLFELVFKLNMPLIAYFGTWFAFIIWIFETRKERKIWVILLIILIIVVLIAVNCMNCIRF
jgi:hypothetical protein